jgi:hypothetical protein
MNPIDWSFNLKQFLIALIITEVSVCLSFVILVIRRRIFPKSPASPFYPIDNPNDTLNNQSGKNTDNKPNNRGLSDGIN